MINIFKNQKALAKNDHKALAKNEMFQNSKFAHFSSKNLRFCDISEKSQHDCRNFKQALSVAILCIPVKLRETWSAKWPN